MHKIYIYSILILILPIKLLGSIESNSAPFEFDVEKLKEERNISNYSLNQIIDTIQYCVKNYNRVCIPKI